MNLEFVSFVLSSFVLLIFHVDFLSFDHRPNKKTHAYLAFYDSNIFEKIAKLFSRFSMRSGCPKHAFFSLNILPHRTSSPVVLL